MFYITLTLSPGLSSDAVRNCLEIGVYNVLNCPLDFSCSFQARSLKFSDSILRITMTTLKFCDRLQRDNCTAKPKDYFLLNERIP